MRAKFSLIAIAAIGSFLWLCSFEWNCERLVIIILLFTFVYNEITKRNSVKSIQSQYNAYEHSPALSVKWQKVKLSFGDTYYRIHPAKNLNENHKNHIPLILIHGISYSDVWCYFIENYLKLSNISAPILEYHLYGRGASDSPLIQNNMQLFISQLCELLLFLNFTDKINIIGFSLGGVIAMKFACLFQYKINKLILISPACMTPTSNATTISRTVPILPDLIVYILQKMGVSKLNVLGETDGFYWETSKEFQSSSIHVERKQIMKNIAYRWLRQMEQNEYMLWSLLSTLRYFPLCNSHQLIQTLAKSINTKGIFIIWPENDTICPWMNGGDIIYQKLQGCKLHIIDRLDHNDTLTPYGLTFCLNKIHSFLSQ
eukprot:185205_1